MPRQWRTEGETWQTLPKHKGFVKTATVDVAFDVVNLVGAMEEGVKISLVVELAGAYIEFDGGATTSSMFIPAGNGYFDEGISILSKISAMNAVAGQNCRVRGILWGR